MSAQGPALHMAGLCVSFSKQRAVLEEAAFASLLEELYCCSRENLTIDHVLPISRGGEWKWENLAKLQRRRQELTQTTPDQPVDDEAVYYKVAGECPKGRVYGLGSLGRKKRRYADADASTSQVLAQRGMGNFMILRLRSGQSKGASAEKAEGKASAAGRRAEAIGAEREEDGEDSAPDNREDGRRSVQRDRRTEKISKSELAARRESKLAEEGRRPVQRRKMRMGVVSTS
ncbi:hypothetical protein Scep_007727 [Stephania cephalantha]|uniref:HNH endonuclease n=1 Tax=Stephania cephalantha TaxID=152367 RepID=A0AAP0KBN6_9MAGN